MTSADMGERKIDADCLVSVVAPLSNSGAVLAEFVDELDRVLRSHYANYEIILVDDGSSDATAKIVSAILGRVDCVRYLRLSRRFGLEIAIAAGFESAIGDFVVVAIPEYDPVSAIPQIVELAREKGTVVIGRSRGKRYGFVYGALYRLFYALCNRTLALNLIPNTTYFMALGRPVLNSINEIKDTFRYIKTFTNFLGFRVQLYDYDLLARGGRRWRRGVWEGINLALDIVVSNSVRPLRFVSLLGLLVSAVNLAYFGYIGLVTFLKDQVAEGWVTLSTQIALGFFVVSLVLGMLSEYLARLLLESKERPNYFVVEERNSSVLLLDHDRRRNVVNSSIS